MAIHTDNEFYTFLILFMYYIRIGFYVHINMTLLNEAANFLINAKLIFFFFFIVRNVSFTHGNNNDNNKITVG